jgi:hypothetical protein
VLISAEFTELLAMMTEITGRMADLRLSIPGQQNYYYYSEWCQAKISELMYGRVEKAPHALRWT